MQTIKIANQQVGSGQPCFILAEAGVNHNGNLDMAFQLIDVAAQAGADAIKFQTFKTERLVTLEAPKAQYQQKTTSVAETQYEMLKRLELSLDTHRELIDYCKQKNILFLSTPFDEQSADLLDELGVPAFKIPSGELTNLPFLEHIARKSKPMIVSTGMSYLGEVEQAVQAIEGAGDCDLILLHCVSNYPADPADTNLRAMTTMGAAFGVPVGYSDHTLGIEVALAAVALGACVIEKHFTLDKTLPGPDHQASSEPDELVALVSGIRKVETALGLSRKQPVANEANTAQVARKSLVAAQDLAGGTVLTEAMITFKRPGSGLPPTFRPHLVGLRLNQDVKAGRLLNWELFA